jgi:hypothetical protein
VVSGFESRCWVSDAFLFVDATAIITKNALWEDRDRAIADGLEQLDNQQVGKYAADEDVRTGSVFSKCRRRARYRGWAKVRLQAFVEALTQKLKRAIVLIDAVPTLG